MENNRYSISKIFKLFGKDRYTPLFIILKLKKIIYIKIIII